MQTVQQAFSCPQTLQDLSKLGSKEVFLGTSLPSLDNKLAVGSYRTIGGGYRKVGGGYRTIGGGYRTIGGGYRTIG